MRPVDIMTGMRWIAFIHLAVIWNIYELRLFGTSITTSVGSDGDIWRSRADLYELEYGLNLALDKEGWNVASGGMPQTAYMIPHHLLETLLRPEVVRRGRTHTERVRERPPSINPIDQKRFPQFIKMQLVRLDRHEQYERVSRNSQANKFYLEVPNRGVAR